MSASADISKLLAGLRDSYGRVVAAAERGVNVAGEHIIGDSQQLCPVDTGALAASGTTLPAEVNGTKITKTIGHNVNYAAAVHERYPTSPAGEESKADFKARKVRNKAAGKSARRRNPQGQGKFLEKAIKQNASKFKEFVTDEARKAL